MKGKKLFNRIASFALAVVMMFSVFAAVTPEEAKAADYTLKGSGKDSITITDAQSSYFNGGEYTWLKIKPKADGYVTFTVSNASALDNYTDGTWGLFDASKKQISRIDGFDTSKTESYYKSNTYGVKKNKVYYLRVFNYVGAKISSNVVKVKESSGTKKTKAKTIKKGKTVKGTIGANSKEADWYKFKVTKKQYLKISYSAKTNYGIKMTVYEGKKSLGSVSPNYTSSKTKSTYVVNAYTNKKIKVNPGTFYVKVERYDNNSSGYYTLKWS